MNLIITIFIIFISFIIIFYSVENINILFLLISISIIPLLYYLSSKKWELVIFLLLWIQFETFRMLPNSFLNGFKLPFGGSIIPSDLSFLFLVLISLQQEYKKRWNLKLFNKPYFKAIILILILVVLQLFWAIIFKKNIILNTYANYIRTSSVFFLAFVFVVQINSENKLEKLIKVLYFLGLLYSLSVILAFVGRIFGINFLATLSAPRLMSDLETGTKAVRYFSNSGMSIHAYVIIYSIIALIEQDFKIIKRPLIIITLILASIALIFSGTRSIYLTIPVSIILTTIIFTKKISIKTIKPIVAFFIIIITVGLIFYYISPAIIEVFYKRAATMRNIGEIGTFQSRLQQIEYTWTLIIKEKAILGFGVDYYKQYYDAEGMYSILRPFEILHQRPISDCGYSQYALKYGPFVGFIGFILIMISAFNELYKLSDKIRKKYIVLIQTLIGSIIFLMIKGYSFDIGASIKGTATYICLILAITNSLTYFDKYESKD